MRDATRSYKTILRSDLQRLAEIAELDSEAFFRRKPDYAALRDRVLAVALCQGAALHYVNGRNGIKDLDVWTFYSGHPDLKIFPPRRRKSYDFENRKFGMTSGCPQFIGRRPRTQASGR
jgi:hypothetical protein